MKARELTRKKIPKDAVLLIPEPEEGESPTCGVKPGYYNSAQMLALIQDHKLNPDAVHFIADMLETGDAENDGFAVMLRANCRNPAEIDRIVSICKE